MRQETANENIRTSVPWPIRGRACHYVGVTSLMWVWGALLRRRPRFRMTSSCLQGPETQIQDWRLSTYLFWFFYLAQFDFLNSFIYVIHFYTDDAFEDKNKGRYDVYYIFMASFGLVAMVEALSIILCVRANVSKVYDIYLILYPSLPHLLDIFFLLLKPGIEMIW